ncbi:GNAT family N-acetyltransferase [Legionella micdadei]|uniref:Acetyltransferase (GNAT) family protein n=1 Tax=Legionella micdadei TaxID=451 RepID=A0A098GFF0_LEGMI|nr:GNAT family N-acetyltransferase [Legionella micdadei]ARG98132.1 GNAT family N-acetyltransferase [Legionella micdadei]KTD30024.1 GNAT family acetyltransferase [Legionella micdadei]NSL18597.1 GNAT family N-acetyltransferase [Legionella micdadei]CEG60216.1 Acyl-CoA N-acyltransferase [Legionella micdadei]SCY58508.1 Acetyltransferase (GNAT) family protein [Legionella micdadei]
MLNVKLTVEKSPSDADNAILRKGIIEFNVNCLHERGSQFSVFARDDQNKIIGGALIWQHSDALYIDVLWIESEFRKKLIGSRLIEQIIEQARIKQLSKIFVDTFDFQALDFYKRHGFHEIGRIEKYLLGHDRIYLKKEMVD